MTLSSNDSTGMLKCCITPGRSQKRTSTNFTSSSLRYRRSSSGLANTRPPGTSLIFTGGVTATWWLDATLGAGSCFGVSLLFPSCYVAREGPHAPRPAESDDTVAPCPGCAFRLLVAVAGSARQGGTPDGDAAHVRDRGSAPAGRVGAGQAARGSRRRPRPGAAGAPG